MTPGIVNTKMRFEGKDRYTNHAKTCSNKYLYERGTFPNDVFNNGNDNDALTVPDALVMTASANLRSCCSNGYE